MAQRHTASNSWLVDNWKVLAIGAGLLAIGMALILASGHAFRSDDESILKDLVEYLGKALLVGAVVELVFAVVLVNDVLKRIHAEVAEIVRDHLPAAKCLLDAGLCNATDRFDLDAFLAEIRGESERLDVAVMQSQVFELDHFVQILRACQDSPAKVKQVRLLFCNPASPYGIARFQEIHTNTTPEHATTQMKAHLMELLNESLKDTLIQNLIASGNFAIRLHDRRTTMSVYRIGNLYRVGWFPLKAWCVSSPHVHCRFPVTGKSDKPARFIGGLARDEFEYLWTAARSVEKQGERWVLPQPEQRPEVNTKKAKPGAALSPVATRQSYPETQ